MLFVAPVDFSPLNRRYSIKQTQKVKPGTMSSLIKVFLGRFSIELWIPYRVSTFPGAAQFLVFLTILRLLETDGKCQGGWESLMLLIIFTVTTPAGSKTPRRLLQFNQISTLSPRNRISILPSDLQMDTPVKLSQYKKICRDYRSPTKHLCFVLRTQLQSI